MAGNMALGSAARRRVGAALGALALVATAAGCSGSHPNTVAYVGEERITQQQLDAAVAGVEETLEPGQQVAVSAVTNVLIHGAIAEQIAASRSITVTDAERDAVLRTSNLASLLEVPEAKSVAYDVATQQIVAGKIGAETYLAETGEMRVTLNPRFGVLDPAQKTIVDGQSSSLSRPAPAQTP